MKDNRQILEKFDRMAKDFNLITIPNIELSPEEADGFLDCIVDESRMKDYARVIKMTTQEKDIRHLGFGDGDFLYAANYFNESHYKKQWIENRITLSTKKVRGCIVIPDDDLEDVRGVTSEAQYVNQLMQHVAKKVANDLEYNFYMGDTNQLHKSWCREEIGSLWDGWRYQINHSQAGEEYENDVCGSAQIKDACDSSSDAEWDFPGLIVEQNPAAPYNWEFKYHKMIKNMPSMYKANNGLANMVFMNNDLVTMDYLEALSERGTQLGDGIFQGKLLRSYLGVPIVDIPLMPVNLGADDDDTYGGIGDGSYTDAMLIPKGNLIIGLQRKIRIESERSAKDEATYYFYTMRVDLAIENIAAVVFVRCLTHEC